MIRTYLDAGVLIAAARGKAPLATKALNILDDPNRQFVSSVFPELEVLPKAVYHKNTSEVEFYEEDEPQLKLESVADATLLALKSFHLLNLRLELIGQGFY